MLRRILPMKGRQNRLWYGLSEGFIGELWPDSDGVPINAHGGGFLFRNGTIGLVNSRP
jgi:hypothetical protein